MTFSIRNIKLFLAAFILLMMQICFFALNSEYINERYIRGKKEESYLRHFYSTDPYWEKLIQQLEVIKYINKSAYEQVLQEAIKHNVKALSLLISEAGYEPGPQQQTKKVITPRMLDHLFAYKSTFTPVVPLQDQRVTTEFQAMSETVLPTTDETHRVTSVIRAETDLTLTPQVQAPTKKINNKNISKFLCHPHFFLFHGRERISNIEYGMSTLQNMFNDTLSGGRWFPRFCKPHQRIAIIIPYRDRDKNLKFLLQNLIPKLRRQMVDYTFYVIEQAYGSRFNRGLIRNIGFLEARKEANYDCYVFNDVDTIIENDLNFYTCKPNAAYHMSVRVQRNDYKLLYHELVGGILSFYADFFWKTNGYSNFFFIWGGEDDAMYQRILAAKGEVLRPEFDVTQTTTVTHDRDEKYEERHELLNLNNHFWKKDGLNTVEYQRIRIEKRKLYTWVYVDIDEAKYIYMMRRYITEWNRLHPATKIIEKPSQNNNFVRKNWSFKRKKSIFTILEELNRTLAEGNFPHGREYFKPVT